MKMNLNGHFGKNNALESTSAGEKGGKVFFLFCLWTLVSLSRPQDFFPALAPLRPALTMGVLTLFFYFLNFKRKSLIVLKEKQVRYFFLLVLIMILSIPTSLYIMQSLEKFFLEYTMVVAYFVIFVLIVDSIDKIYKVLFLACVGCGIYSFFTVMSGTFESGRLEFGSMFDANDLAFFVLCFIPLNLIFISKDNKLLTRILCLTALLLGIVLIFLSGSRGGMLALGFAFSAILFRKTISVKKGFKIFAVIAGALMLSVSSIDTDRLMTLFTLKQDYNFTAEGGRLDLWGIGIKAMLENPLTGVGVGSFPNAVGNQRKRLDADTQAWQRAHNSVIQIGTETGVFGLMLFLMLSWNVAKIFARTSREATSIKLKKIGEMGLAGFLGMFTAAFFLSQAYSIYWAFYIMFSVVVFRFLSRELALEGKKAKL